jgi:hypothetical protein
MVYKKLSIVNRVIRVLGIFMVFKKLSIVNRVIRVLGIFILVNPVFFFLYKKYMV